MASKVASAIRKWNGKFDNIANYVANHGSEGAVINDIQVYDFSASGFGETEIVDVMGKGKYINGTLILKPVTLTGKVDWAGTSKIEETTFTINGVAIKMDV